MPITAKERNKRWFPVLIACAVLIGASMWISALIPTDTAPRTTATTDSTRPAFPQRLGVYDGKLARFSQNGTVPLEVYEVDIATLPAEEQTRLQHGVAVTDADTLAALLENYTS